MRRPFQVSGRTGWFAEVEHRDGRRERKGFEHKRDAARWLQQMQAAIDAEFAPALGGPAAVTLGQMLVEYARLYTINKRGWSAELTRINHYLADAGLGALHVVLDAHGQRHLEQAPARPLPKGFVGYRDRRLTARERTYRVIAGLGAMTVSRITSKHVQELASTMRADGLSESTVQKEIALLKHAFNEAIRVWSWSLLRNPCNGIRFGRSQSRFVRLDAEDRQRLAHALLQCDNPQFLPLVELALATTLRRGSLLALRWSQIDLESPIAHVWTKGFMSDIPLAPRAVAILRRLRQVAPPGQDAVFTMTANAVDLAWKGTRERAGLPTLQFRDLRHVGATFYARYLSAHELQQVLGHRTTAMAQVYVNLACNDVAAALADAEAQAEAQACVQRPLPRVELPAGLRKLPRAASGRPRTRVSPGELGAARADDTALSGRVDGVCLAPSTPPAATGLAARPADSSDVSPTNASAGAMGPSTGPGTTEDRLSGAVVIPFRARTRG